MCFSLPTRPLPRSTLFPYTTLFRSRVAHCLASSTRHERSRPCAWANAFSKTKPPLQNYGIGLGTRDRKSTRLNSSHTVISYAVFCLKKKNQEDQNQPEHSRVGELRE